MHWLAVFAALFSVVTLGYLMRVVNKVMFLRPGEEPTRSQESPATMVAAMLVMVLISLAAGIGFKPVLDWLVGPAAQVLLNGAGYAATVLGG
jgi:NADH:ubiquinone oxidoreductase subunit 2 (subunit N)